MLLVNFHGAAFNGGGGCNSGIFRKSSRGDNPQEGTPCYLEGTQSEGATNTQCAAVRLQKKSKGILAGILPVLPDFDRVLATKGVKCYSV